MNYAVDAVITWVDGNDPAHAEKLARHLASTGAETRPRGAHASRFAAQGELDYCVASLLRFAPWLRTIHIVTDAQRPALLDQLAGTPYAERVRVVDHTTIFAGYEQYLPSFNSSAILCLLWRIPGLAERFLFLNDDFMLLRPVRESDFFSDDGVVLRGHWRGISRSSGWRAWLKRWRGAGADEKSSYLANQERSAQIAGFDKRYLRIVHNPHPWRVSTLRAWCEAHPEILAGNLRNHLRVPGQFNVDGLAAHLELARGDARIDNRLHTVQLKPAAQAGWRLRHKLALADRDERCAFVCVQNLERADAAIQRAIVDWLDRRIGPLQKIIGH